MKLLISFFTLTFCIFTQSNAMHNKPGSQQILHTHLINPDLPPAPALVRAACEGDEVRIDEVFAQISRGDHPQTEAEALSIALYKGHRSIVQKLLAFFGEKVSTNDADWAFGVASVCKNESTAAAMISELINHLPFVTALSTSGFNDAYKNAIEKDYISVLNILDTLNTEYPKNIVMQTKKHKR